MMQGWSLERILKFLCPNACDLSPRIIERLNFSAKELLDNIVLIHGMIQRNNCGS